MLRAPHNRERMGSTHGHIYAERRTRAQSCMVRGPRRDRDCRGCLRSGRCEYRVRFAQHDDVRLAFCGQQLLRRDHESWPSWTQDAAPARAVTGSLFSVAMSLAKLPSLGGRRVQFGSQIPESESQTHASRANHSCEVPHDGQNERLKKTGIERNLVRSMYMPVVTAFPVFGQRIMSSPINSLPIILGRLGTIRRR